MKGVNENSAKIDDKGQLLRPSRPRTFKHPGKPNPIRIQSENSPQARHFRLAMAPGKSMFEALVEPLAKMKVYNASLTIFGGEYDSLSFCVAPPDPKKQAVIAYSKPIRAGKTQMIFGNATLGESMEGKPLVHCHAAILTGDGQIKGGHIITENSIIGAKTIFALVTSFDGIKLLQSFDPETNIALLQPVRGN